MRAFIILITLMINFLSAESLLKDGNYSWFNEGAEAFLTITKSQNATDEDKLYHIEGNAYWGVGRKYGPNLGDLDFTAPLKDGNITYLDTIEKYTFILSLKKDGGFKVVEHNEGAIFGYNVSFEGDYTSDNSPSYSCKKVFGFVHKAICNNLKIARYDREMARGYVTLRATFSSHKKGDQLKKSLKLEQRKWIKKRNRCASEEKYMGCLAKSYQIRIEQLNQKFSNFWKE